MKHNMFIHSGQLNCLHVGGITNKVTEGAPKESKRIGQSPRERVKCILKRCVCKHRFSFCLGKYPGEQRSLGCLVYLTL